MNVSEIHAQYEVCKKSLKHVDSASLDDAGRRDMRDIVRGSLEKIAEMIRGDPKLLDGKVIGEVCDLIHSLYPMKENEGETLDSAMSILGFSDPHQATEIFTPMYEAIRSDVDEEVIGQERPKGIFLKKIKETIGHDVNEEEKKTAQILFPIALLVAQLEKGAQIPKRHQEKELIDSDVEQFCREFKDQLGRTPQESHIDLIQNGLKEVWKIKRRGLKAAKKEKKAAEKAAKAERKAAAKYTKEVQKKAAEQAAKEEKKQAQASETA